MKVSVIIVNTNEKHRLIYILPSILGAKSDFNFEIIISDNGSTDGSREYVKENYPQIRIIENGKNLGFALANNVAAQESKADILVFINPDTTVEPGWIENLLKPFSDHNVGLTTSKILLMSARDKINTCGSTIHISGITQCRGINEPAVNFSVTEEIPAVSGAAFAIRRKLFEKLKGFDSDFFIYLEETDLSIRARIMGYKCIYVPNSIIYHDYELRFGSKKVFFEERNRYLMLLKNLEWKTLILLIPILFFAEIVTWGFVVMYDRKNIKNKWLAYLWIINHWHLIVEKKKAVKKDKVINDSVLLSSTVYRINFSQIVQNYISKIAQFSFDVVFSLLRKLLLKTLSFMEKTD
jgi:GT2 family glycosyltransferase